MSWRIFSPSFAPADGGFHLMAPNGERPVATWVSPTRSAVTICRFLREFTSRGLSIAVRIVVRIFSGSAACAAQLPVSPVAVNTTVENSICGFGLSSVAGIGDPGPLQRTRRCRGRRPRLQLREPRACHVERQSEHFFVAKLHSRFCLPWPPSPHAISPG